MATPPLLTRRLFLVDLGAAVAAVTLAACTGSSGESPTAPGASQSPTTSSGGTPNASAPATRSASDGSTPSDVMQWERVIGGAAAAYVLVRSGEATVVDTGFAGTAPDITTALAALGSSWADVSTVVLTHHHTDHVEGLGEVAELATDARLAAGAGDIEAISAPRDLVAVGTGDRIMGLQVLETPGHTPGHISVFDPGTGVLVAGDALNSTEGGDVAGPNPAFSDDIDLAWDSAGVLADLEPSVILVGHGPPVDEDVAADLQTLVDTHASG
ncbi:MAG TPA: MBL fold metallo-hydrolase [Nitriliruptoraceae bacterium]|nr:MBL fold metallo-hydrolase [Nitriliruptoraceae bacterium]